MTITFNEFYVQWNSCSPCGFSKQPKRRKCVYNDKKPYFISTKYGSKLKYTNLYKMYLHTECMPMPAFKRCIYYFMSVHDFKDWKRRFEWIKNHYSDKAITEDKMMAYYGKEEGLKRWKAYCEKQSYTNTFEYKHKKYGMSEEGFLEYNKLRATTLENMISKYGVEEGTERFNSYVEKQKDAGCSLKYFQEKYGEIEGEKYYKDVNKRKSMTLNNFIRIYGEELGKQKYLECKEKHRNLMVNKFSNVSLELFDAIQTSLPEEIQKNVHYHFNEYYIITQNNNTYYFDFYIDKLKYVIEFYGDYWHLNPLKYKSDELVSYKGKEQVLPKEKWAEDKKRLDEITNEGYTIQVVWESDYKNNKDKIVDTLVSDIIQRWRKLGDKN